MKSRSKIGFASFFLISFLTSTLARAELKPLPFDLSQTISGEGKLVFEYSLVEGGNTLKVGPEDLSDKTLSFHLGSLGKLFGKRVGQLRDVDPNDDYLLIRWPNFLKPDSLDVLSSSGKILLKIPLANHHYEKWEKNQKISKMQLGLNSTDFDMDRLKSTKGSFRFCLIQTKERAYSRLCSSVYGLDRRGKTPFLRRVRRDPVEARVLIGGEEGKKQDLIPLEKNQLFRFYGETQFGLSYDFVTKPPTVQVRDIQKLQNSFQIYLLNALPISEAKLNLGSEIASDSPPDSSNLWSFGPTIVDERRVLIFPLKPGENKIYLSSEAGGVFRQEFDLTALPSTEDRILIEASTPTTTYVEEAKVFGQTPKGSKILSKQSSVEVLEGGRFLWRTQNLHHNQYNKSYLLIKKGDQEFKSYYEFFKGYPREVSFRLTATSGKSGAASMAEGALNYWFEDLFGWSHYLLSRLRWGISAKYFQHLSGVLFDTPPGVTPESSQLKVTTLDFKYRLASGIWGRDESVGFLASYQGLLLENQSLTLYGAGLFWARSMPAFFDRLFNYIPGLHYPKWVDMEYIQYFSTPTSNFALGSNYALNFHGKVFWTPAFFGEAGFGVKQYSLESTTNQVNVSLNSLYATVGLGLNF